MTTPLPTSSTEPIKWIVHREPLQSTEALVQQWNLECPAHGEEFSNSPLVTIRGWAVAATPSRQPDLHVVVRLPGRSFSYPLCENRPDVLQHVFKGVPEVPPHLLCGFSLTVASSEAVGGFQLGFEVDGLIQSAARISPG